MNRFHVHLNVSDLDASIRFYTRLFGGAPAVVKPDYAKWMLDDPRVNFAISNTGRAPGIDHLGLQADDDAGLQELGRRLDAAGGEVIAERAAICCYAQSDKYWTEDPQGTRWEAFHTLGDATAYHAPDAACATAAATCTPKSVEAKPRIVAGACCAPDSSCC